MFFKKGEKQIMKFLTNKKSRLLYSSILFLFTLNILSISIYSLSYFGFTPSSWMDSLLLNPIISLASFLIIQVNYKTKNNVIYFIQTVNVILFVVPVSILLYAIFKFLNIQVNTSFLFQVFNQPLENLRPRNQLLQKKSMHQYKSSLLSPLTNLPSLKRRSSI